MKKNVDHAIGVDLGGTSIKFALCSVDGKIVYQGQRPTRATGTVEEIIADLATVIEQARDKAAEAGIEPLTVGMGTPGSVDIDSGYLLGSTPNFQNWRDVPVAAELSTLVNLPVFVDNDANLMALGEHKYGAGRNFKDMICLTIGTGVGGGIILNNELYRGSFYAGAELGHMSIKEDGIPCNCGGKGCLERYASATAMIQNYKEYLLKNDMPFDESQLNVKHIFELFQKGDRIAEKTIEQSVYFLGRGVANLINIFNPQVIVIGGGVAEAGQKYIEMVKQIARHYAMIKPLENVKLIGAQLGNSAGFLGAAAFALNRLKIEK